MFIAASFFLILTQGHIFIAFREREREREREKHWLVAFPYVPLPEVKPATQVCVLTGNQTRNISVYGTMLQTNWATLARAIAGSVLIAKN